MKKTDPAMAQIRKIEDKYGLILFRMALSHLIYTGAGNFTQEDVEEAVRGIEARVKQEESEGKKSVMTVNFQIDIVRCAAEIAEFSIWTLIKYIKKYVTAE